MTMNSFEQICLNEILDRSDESIDNICDHYLSSFWLKFYRFKLIICILLGLFADDLCDPVNLMVVELSSWCGGWDAVYARVGFGFWRGWHYSFLTDGDSFL